MLLIMLSCQIDFSTGSEAEVGGVYKGIVTSIKDYGAYVEFNGGQQGLLHISELAHDRVSETTILYLSTVIVATPSSCPSNK